MLNAHYEVPSEIISRYRAEGFVHFAGLIDPAVLGRYGPEITRLTLALNTQDKPLDQRETYERAFLQVMNLWRESEIVKEFVFGERLAGVAAQLLGVTSVRLYHDQSLYKEPSGGITPAHADQYYWPLSSDRTITAWIPLQPVPREMGPLEFFSGSHLSKLGRDLAISDASEAQITTEMAAQGFFVTRSAYDFGDVSFHSGWTFHRAGPNQSTRPRSVMTVIYMDADIKVAPPANAMQKSDLAKWLPGLKPGDVAASLINPVLYLAD